MSELNIPAESIRLADGTALITDGAINPALLPVGSHGKPSPHIDSPVELERCTLFVGEKTLNVHLKRRARGEEDEPLTFVKVPLGGYRLSGRERLADDSVHPDDLLVRVLEHVLTEGECGHDDSSTGDDPAATGSTDRVEVAARRGDDSSPDGHANSADRIIRQLAELQRSVLDVLSWWDIVHGDPASEVAEGFLADAIAALRKEVRR